jgi:hypothetical protein
MRFYNGQHQSCCAATSSTRRSRAHPRRARAAPVRPVGVVTASVPPRSGGDPTEGAGSRPGVVDACTTVAAHHIVPTMLMNTPRWS